MTNSARTLDMQLHLHPQTDPRLHEQNGPLVISRGYGATVIDDSGRQYVEGMSGLWCAALGFSNARLADTAHRQLKRLATYHTFNHRSNEACTDLIEQISSVSPLKNGRIFLVSSGSEANDTMVKLAWFYHCARGRSSKRRIISRRSAFHGSTVMGAALSGLPHMHQSFNLPPLGVLFAGRPHFYRDSAPSETEEQYVARLVDELESLIVREGAENIAAMIAEPIMGAGGVLIPPAGYFPKIEALLRANDILLLADEVVCGFGRTGSWFGCQTYGFMPDMLSMAKGLSSGHLPIGAVAMSDSIYQTVADEAHRAGVFGHGFTYSGHPVCSAVAAESIRIYQEMDAVSLTRHLGADLRTALRDSLAEHPLVGEIRSEGFIAGIELVADRSSRTPFDPGLRIGALVEQRCRHHGVMIRNMGDVLAICPPFVITPAEIEKLTDGIKSALNDVLAGVVRQHYATA
jgi:4-aminobutyrate--pyruvate transaminase